MFALEPALQQDKGNDDKRQDYDLKSEYFFMISCIKWFLVKGKGKTRKKRKKEKIAAMK